MNTKSPFEILNERLKCYENGTARAYQNTTYIISNIRSLAYSGEKTSEMLNLYLSRIDKIMNSPDITYNNKACHYDEIIDFGTGWSDDIDTKDPIPLEFPVALTKIEKEEELPKLVDELSIYYEKLSQLVRQISNSNENVEKAQIVKEINIVNFSLPSLKEAFAPKITALQAAFILHYFRAEELIPNYKNMPLGIIGEALFGLSRNTIGKSLSKTNNSKVYREDLKKIRIYLETIIIAIDADIK